MIPRFQREYSWDKRNYEEFLNDMLGNLVIENGSIKDASYFLGTMLFVGNIMDGTKDKIWVVDGQQRLTTITILFSAMADTFQNINKKTLADKVFTYIMHSDDDGNKIKVLDSSSSYPFFAYYIQDQNKVHEIEPESEEEILIRETYLFFKRSLRVETLKEDLIKFNPGKKSQIMQLDHVSILRALRDQILNSIFVSISTTDQKEANRIFAILNAKGKRLDNIDLIKNDIFEILDDTEPADYAQEQWNNIQKELQSGNETIGVATFYRHYWISKYHNTSSKNLYDAFKKEIGNNKDHCTDFLDDMLRNAKYYRQVIYPNRVDYNNRKEYFWLVQSLNALTNYFSIVQIRIALLALFDAKENDIIKMKKFKDTVTFLENFHFVYNALMVGRSNRLNKIYSEFAISLRRCKNGNEADAVINERLVQPLTKLLPKYSDFEKHFIKLSFSSKGRSTNTKTKYVIEKLACLMDGKELFYDDSSIEHIASESTGSDEVLNIGNLILLEGTINNSIQDAPYKKKIIEYKKSKYRMVQDFIKEHPNWDCTMIEDRSKSLARLYYTRILGLSIS